MTPADEMPTINKRGIDTIMSLKKKIAAAFIACAMTLAVVPSAFACTALYVGSDLTEDGTLFPAHAGVIPSKARILAIPAAFPRPRGGDPYSGGSNAEADFFSPPTRG